MSLDKTQILEEAQILATFLPLVGIRLKDVRSLERDLGERGRNFLSVLALMRQTEAQEDRDFKLEIGKDLIRIACESYKIRSSLNFKIRNLYFSELLNLEVSAGTGGQEAELFANEILSRYHGAFKRLNFKDLKLEGNTLSFHSDHYEEVREECGIHRVQRVPVTESSGRIHTSTVAVGIKPVMREFEVRINKQELLIESMRSSGAGGQHVNTTNSAVRITHLPTKISSRIGTSRVQQENKEEAMRVVGQRLKDFAQDRFERLFLMQQDPKLSSRRREDKIRTYNFLEDRITNHKLRSNLYSLKQIGSNDKDFAKMLRDFNS